MQVLFTARFLRSYNKLLLPIREDVEHVVALLEKNPKDQSLKLHKLKGKMKQYYAISANYSHRIILKIEKDTTYCMDVGDHSIYE